MPTQHFTRLASRLGQLSSPGGSDETDRDLLTRFLKEDDETAFETLVRRHNRLIRSAVTKVLSNPHDAEDAVQATFLILVRRAESLDQRAELGPWLYGVAHRVAVRARHAGQMRVRKEAGVKPANPEPAPDLSWREACALLHVELDKLPGRYRLPLLLCYLEGKTRDEAAAALKVTTSALKWRLERGRRLLHARLARRGVTLSAGLLVAVAAGSASASSSSSLGALLNVVRGAAPARVVTLTREAAMSTVLLKLTTTLVGVGCLVTATFAVLASGATQPMAVPQEKELPPTAFAAEPPLQEPKGDTGRPVHSLSGHAERVTSVAYSPDGKAIATAAWDGTARIWDAKTGTEVRLLDVPTFLNQAVFSPDNEFILVAQQVPPNKPRVIVWDRRTGEEVREFPDPEGGRSTASASCAAFSPDGKYLACGGWESADNKGAAIRLYEFATGKLVREMRGQTSVESLTFSPDGKTLFSQGSLPRPRRLDGGGRPGLDPDVVRVWDVATGKERRSGLDGLVVEHLALSPDGRALAHGGSAHAITLRETATGGPRVELTGHTDKVMGIAFSPDGRTIATASTDKTVRLWDRLSGKEIGRLEGHRDTVLSVAFAPDGRTLVSGGLDKTAHVWDVSKITGRPRVSAERSPSELEVAWKDLGGDASKGSAALGQLVSSPVSGVPFLGKRLAASVVDTKPIEQLIGKLGDEEFQVREQATKELRAMGDRAAPSIRKALAGSPSPEANQRLGELLTRIDGAVPSAETLRELRAVEVLEAIGTAEALTLLDALAAGSPGMRLTQEAKASAGRLAVRIQTTPAEK